MIPQLRLAAMSLTDIKIRQAKPLAKTYKLTDSGGLYVEIRPNGSKLWRYRYRIAGVENTYAIGAYPEVSLSEARSEREKAREHVKAGRHPSHVRQTELATQVASNRSTFQSVAEEWIADRLGQRTATYRSQCERALQKNVYPVLGRLPLREISAAQVLDVLKRMEKRGANTLAIQVRQWMSAVFCFGVATLRADVDPAAALRGAIKRMPISHSRPMSIDQVRGFLAATDRYQGHRITVIALKLLPLLFMRTIELRQGRWGEVDLDAGAWLIPADRMKMRRNHLIPLPAVAIQLLEELKRITGAGELMFPGMRDPSRPLSATTLNRALEYMGMDEWHCHDFRATASTHLYESGLWRPEAIEMQLAHAEKSKTRAAYNHAEYFAERQRMLEWWTDKLTSIKVIV